MKRFVIFNAKVQTIYVWKCKFAHTYTLEENRFIDLIDDEYEAFSAVCSLEGRVAIAAGNLQKFSELQFVGG